ncbi:hypothetical protein [Actinomadura sp. 21ATH]|uniref:hypothetical protein n=1 Tax=Actinomadura sp. 21ATH TaxID=1735444 RepID=UPI0035C0734F
MRARIAIVAGVVSLVGLVPAPASAGGGGIVVRESKGRVTATGAGFTLKLTRHGIRTAIDEDRFGDPGTGNPVQRQVIDLAGAALRPFECANGTYTITGGTFERTFRISVFERRPAPYPAGFATAFPGLLTPFVGVLDGTVTDGRGETLRFLISDLVHESAAGGFSSAAPIHGFFVDGKGRIRDRISLTGRYRNGRYWIEDRGTCRQTADLPYGPGSENAVVTGPLFVFPFSAPVVRP